MIEWKPAALHVGEKLHLDHTIFGEDFQFLQGLVSGDVTPKLTIPSPSMVHYRGGTAALDPDVYPDVDKFWADLTATYNEEVKALAALGCTYLQFDDTSLAYLNDPAQREQMANKGEDAEHLHEAYIRHINEALDGRPEGLTVTTHLCRGNFRSSWAAEGGYDFVAEALFGELNVDGFFLEYDDARSGGFEPLRFVPKNKLVVLGPGHDQAARAREQGPAQAPHRGGHQVHRDRAAVPVGAVRVLLDGRGQRADARRADRQAQADRRDRGRGLGMSGAAGA